MNKTLTSYVSIDFWNGFLGRWSTTDGNPWIKLDNSPNKLELPIISSSDIKYVAMVADPFNLWII